MSLLHLFNHVYRLRRRELLLKPVSLWNHLEINFASECKADVNDDSSPKVAQCSCIVLYMSSANLLLYKCHCSPPLNSMHHREEAMAGCPASCILLQLQLKLLLCLTTQLWPLVQALEAVPPFAHGEYDADNAGAIVRAASVVRWVQPRAAAVHSLRVRGSAEGDPAAAVRRLLPPSPRRLHDLTGCGTGLAQ